MAVVFRVSLMEKEMFGGEESGEFREAILSCFSAGMC